MRFAAFVYDWHFRKRSTPMKGFDEETWRRLCQAYQKRADVSAFFPDEPVPFRMVIFPEIKLTHWVHEELIPYMTLKRPNRKHSVYELKHIAEKEIERYVCQGELQAVLARCGFPMNDYYPIREEFFKKR